VTGSNQPPGGAPPSGGAAFAVLALFCVAAVLLIVHPWSWPEKLFAVAYGLDPQRPSHSYVLGGVQMPLEARKVGMFGGFLVTCLALAAIGRARAAAFPPRRILAVLVLFVALMGFDGVNATLYDLTLPHLYAPDLRLRLATGLLTGLAMASLLLPALNGSLWRSLRLVPSLANGRELAGALLICAGFGLLVDARRAVLYYPISAVSVGGLLIELAAINTIFLLVLLRRVGTADRWRDALPTTSLALLATVLELAVMSLVRYVTLGDSTNFM
jgi:uncharacterized membrane protein